MIKSGIFNSVNGDRRYKAEDFAAYFASFIGNGVFPNPNTGFQVIANGDMNVLLKAGQAWINGYYITNTDDYFMKIDVADGVLNRIDRIVLQLNYLNRSIAPVIKKGTFASSPVAPTLKRDADVYEIALADIYVGKGVLSISQANIIDLRLNKDLCGIVHGTVDQVDTTAIFNQFQSWFEMTKQKSETDISTWTSLKQQEFQIWFDSVKGTLSGDVAGNLANQISTHEADTTKHITAAERKSWNEKETPSGATAKVEQTSYKTTKSNKDSNGIYTTVEKRRKSDGTLAKKSVLSGGTSPRYTTRTITYYKPDGITVDKTETFSLTYDADDDLVNEV
ncbi:hypothetical protein AB1283_04240 [Bacillus sp. S13(2024)]|uniref:hypothetical protein n=1 Tax=unclassified Bacillus (in: firmicutes) TaxID=185979 RepID=UPI003D1B7ADF